ncbi:type II toxin-antitoxin system VapC family toxin [Humibacter soli]
MRILLDTHVLLWWQQDDPRLSRAHRNLIRGPENVVLVSAISVAEASIKASLGKLEIVDDLVAQLEIDGFEELPFIAEHAEALRDLPLLHRDPFDRMLVVQAKVEGIPLLTVDPRVKAYDVATI